MQSNVIKTMTFRVNSAVSEPYHTVDIDESPLSFLGFLVEYVCYSTEESAEPK